MLHLHGGPPRCTSVGGHRQGVGHYHSGQESAHDKMRPPPWLQMIKERFELGLNSFRRLMFFAAQIFHNVHYVNARRPQAGGCRVDREIQGRVQAKCEAIVRSWQPIERNVQTSGRHRILASRPAP